MIHSFLLQRSKHCSLTRKSAPNQMMPHWVRYLAWGVLDHSERTMFDGILQLRPAHAMVVTKDGAQSPFRYWDAKVNTEIRANVPDAEVVSKIRSLLHDATSIHLRSDVAVGTCLSGVSIHRLLRYLINNLIREEAPSSVGKRQKTFSAVFSDTRFDESRYIGEIVAVTGVNNRQTEPSAEDLWNDIDQLSLYAGRTVWFIVHLCAVLCDADRLRRGQSSAGRPGC